MTENQVDAVATVDSRRDTVSVLVHAPRSPKPRRFKFLSSALVGDAAREAANEFGYAGGNPTFAKARRVLDRAKSLKDAGVRDKDELDLVDAGGGV